MARQTTFLVLAVVLLASLLGWLMSSSVDTSSLDRGLPWQIEVLEDGSSRVFQIHLGTTTLDEVSRNFREQPEYTLFVTEGQPPVIEAYFNSLRISGLSAKMIMGFDLPHDVLEDIYQRGVRISTLGSGERKVSISDKDIGFIGRQAIASISYIPSIDLDGELITKRFGEPAERIVENENTEHWLYPAKGLDIVLNHKGRELFQYVRPARFELVANPLKKLQMDKNNE